MPQKTILIKKYENRRLYDSTNSRYVNLDEVARILQRGDDVRVVDAASGEDITRLILTQIIVEDAKTPESNFPLDVLREMVIASGKASQESALKYMKAMLEIYQNTYRVMTPPVNPFEFLQQNEAKRERATKQAGAPPQGVPSERQRRPKQSSGEDVESLKRRLAELEKLVSSFVPAKGKRKK